MANRRPPKAKRWAVSGAQRKGKPPVEKPIPADIYPVIDNDLARDNVENDLPAADREDLQ